MSSMRRNGWALYAALVGVIVTAGSPAGGHAQSAPAAAVDPPPPPMPASLLRDPKVIAIGQLAWQQQCRHCHGASAYPGKAPKLSPGSMEPDFIYDRITYGFKGMPPWKDVFPLEQRVALVAYIKSDSFSP